MLWVVAICSLGFAEPFSPEPLPERFQLKRLPLSEQVPHGPDGPLPDDGFDFEDNSSSSNWLAKIGLLSIATGAGLGVMSLLTSDEVKKSNYGYGSLSALGSGVGLIMLERIF